MKYVKIKCFGCGKEVDKYKKEIDRQIKLGRSEFYCCFPCFKEHKIFPTKHKEIIFNCLICEKEFITSTKKKASKTCSQSCATKLGFKNLSSEEIEIRNNKVKQNWAKGIYKGRIKIPFKLKCIICNNDFETKNKNAKTCSKECYSYLLKQNSRNNPNCGGETNYKRYLYKDIGMDSSWEVELAKWLDEKNIKWIRSRKICLFWKDESNNLRRYYPDFYLPDYNLYLDPKNKYLQEKDKFKLDNIRSQNIIVLSGYLEDIKNNLILMASVPKGSL